MHLTESEWRMIHNALSVYQSTFGSITESEWAQLQRVKIQQLMNKIRDNQIARGGKSAPDRPLSSYTGAEIDELMKDQ
jgi:hypothetical protein